MNVAIVDDDTYFLNSLKNRLLSYDSNLSIICYSDPYDFMNNIGDVEFVLLDIEMPKIDGISLAKQLRNENIKIYFITSHEELMIKAFCRNVEGFILKENFENGIQEFCHAITKYKEKEYLRINVNQNEIIIYFYEILYISYSLRDVEYHLVSNKTIIQKNINLKNVKNSLNDEFVLINRNTLVNIIYVDKFKNGHIYIRDKKFEVSRRKIKNVKIKLYERRLKDGFSF